MDIEEECVRHASKCWESGLNCAESALRGICFGMGIPLPDVALRIATPFGGGVGRCGDICGALSGSVMGIGAQLGRTDGGQDRFLCYEAAREMRSAFQARFGSTSCEVLNRGDFESEEHEQKCKRITLESVRMACRVLSRHRPP